MYQLRRSSKSSEICNIRQKWSTRYERISSILSVRNRLLNKPASFRLKAQHLTETFNAKVVRIVESDTIEGLTGDNTKFKIRLEGIDTPEPKQAFGNVAKKAVGELTHEKNVTILKTGQDFYGRTLAFVVADGVNVNAELIRLGMAWQYLQYNDDAELAAIELEAREAKRGLWFDAEPVAPWEWRKKQKKDAP